MIKILTISGEIGSGKSAVSKCLQGTLGYDIIGTGAIQREIARKRGMTTLELNIASSSDPSVDEEIDNFVVQLGRSRDRIVVDSRLAWHFISESFKVFLLVDPMIGAQRVFGDQRTEEENPTLERTLANNARRKQLETARFNQLYGVDFCNFGNYDAVVDTSFSEPLQIAEKLVELYRMAHSETRFPPLWLNSKRLLPTQNINALSGEAIDNLRTSIRNHGFDYNNPLEVVEVDSFFYIRDGHKRAIAADCEGVPLLPCRVVFISVTDELANGPSVAEIVGCLESSWFFAWEKVLGYRMSRYP